MMDIITKDVVKLIIFIIIFDYAIFTPGEGQESYSGSYCAHDDFQPTCGAHSVVIIKRALYGRMRDGVCKVKNMGLLGCHKDVSAITHSRCSGRSSCSVRIPNAAFDATRPCDEQYISYLEAEYVCQPVLTSPSKTCKICKSINITAPSGYIASSVAIDTGCGKAHCPWMLIAEAGQKIDFMLLDYSINVSRKINDLCEAYAVLKEPAIDKGISICGSQTQKSHVFRSIGNVVKLSLMNYKKANFLIYYEFVGCPDIIKENVIFTRNGNDAMIKCIDSGEEYNIECSQTSWSNIESVKCLVNDPQSIRSSEDYRFPISPDIFILLISSICFLVGAIILVSGVFCFCKKPVSNTMPLSRPIKDTELYDIVYNEPVRHPGRDLRFREDLQDAIIVQSFPRMSNKKLTRPPSLSPSYAPSYASNYTPIYEVPPGFAGDDE